MNAHTKARNIYAASFVTTKTPRSIEFAIMAKVTRQLQSAAAERSTDFPRFVTALDQNRRLWSMFTTDLLDADNKLDQTLKVQLIELGAFVQKHTTQILAQQAPVKPLLEINAAILRGLKDGPK